MIAPQVVYIDFRPSVAPQAVIGGVLVPVTETVLRSLALNAMVLATAPRGAENTL